MKNLIGAAAPTLSIFKSIQFLMLVLLLTFGFTSCKDQIKESDSIESELIEKPDFQSAESTMDIGGNQLPPGGFCELHSNHKAYKVSTIDGGDFTMDDIGGGKDAGGGPGYTSDYGISNIGGGRPIGELGKHDIVSDFTIGILGKSYTGEYAISTIGGRGGVDPPGGIYSCFHGNDKNKDHESC